MNIIVESRGELSRSAAQREQKRRFAKQDFLTFRRLMRPDMLRGWWVDEVCNELTKFYEAFERGERPWLAIESPPQHGKSYAATDFIGYAAGRNPDCKIIFASYSDELGIRTNSTLQRMMTSDRYQMLYPDTKIEHGNVVTATDKWKRNSSLIEFVDHAGSFRNTTVQGQINGMELNLGVIDDPMKGRAEAHSKTIRDKTWDWFADDFLSRFAENSALLIIQTRWHVDDLLGRLNAREAGHAIKVLKYPAISVQPEQHRQTGEALFPELKSLEFLEQRKKVLSQGSWELLYQQNPIVVGGGMLPVEKFRVIPHWSPSDVLASVRYWDCASSLSKDASFTAGVLLHQMRNGSFVISHVVHGQWPSAEREALIKLWAKADSGSFHNYEIVIEQEPGSAGLDRVQQSIRDLAGFRAFADKVTGHKETRAEPFAAQVQNGNVYLLAGEWIHGFLDECEVYPQGRQDQVDAAGGAFNRLVKSMVFDTSYSWVE